MGRTIDADALWMDIIHNMDYCDDILEIIERQPTIETEQQVARDIATIIENEKDMRVVLQQPQWISCSERLPEPEKKSYWVCTDDGYQCECRWTNVNVFHTNLTTDWHWNVFDLPQYCKVAAWMPLPESYKGDKDGE